jgi:hypothetical protein
MERVNGSQTIEGEDTIIFNNSGSSDDTSDPEDEQYYSRAELPLRSFDQEQLRNHLLTHDWNNSSRKILAPLLSDPTKLSKQPDLFPPRPGPADDRSHYSHFQVYVVGFNGEPELVEFDAERTVSRATEIWQTLRSVGHPKLGRTVGRITIAREPSPILFGALHLTLNDHFDMDELYDHLVRFEPSSAQVHRAFMYEPKQHRTFFFKLEYYTLIGDECKPMRWQRASTDNSTSDGHLP